MHENANVRAVRHIYESIENGDVESILEALSSDVEWRYPAITGVSFGGTWRGREGVREFFGTLAQVRELLEFRPDRYLAQDDAVVAQGRFVLRVNSTGWDAASEWAHVWELKGGKIASFMAYVDTAAVSRAHLGNTDPVSARAIGGSLARS